MPFFLGGEEGRGGERGRVVQMERDPLMSEH